MNLRELQRRGWAVGWICLLVLGLGAGRLTAQEQPPPTPAVPPEVTGLDKIQAVRGERVRFTFDKKDGWPKEPKDIHVFLGGVPAGSAVDLNTDALFFDLVVPGCSPYLPLGAHAVSVTIGDPPVPVIVAAAAGRLEILPNNGGIDPKITGVFPVTAYPEGKPRQYSLRIQGEGFARDACDNRISLGGEAKEICWKGTGCSQGILGEIPQSGLISLSNILLGDHSLDNVGIKVGTRPESTSAIRLSRVSRQFPVRIKLLRAIPPRRAHRSGRESPHHRRRDLRRWAEQSPGDRWAEIRHQPAVHRCGNRDLQSLKTSVLHLDSGRRQRLSVLVDLHMAGSGEAGVSRRTRRVARDR